MRFYTFVVKNVFRRPVRSLLTMLGMAVAVSAFVALLGIANGFIESFLDAYQRRGLQLIVTGTGTGRLTSTIDETFGRKILALPEVVSVDPGLVDMVSVEGRAILGLLVQGLQVDSYSAQTLKLLRGRRLTEADVGKHRAMIGVNEARNLNKGVGDTIDIYEVPFEIVGVYRGMSMLENGMVIVPLPDMQHLMLGRERKVTGFSVRLKPPYTDAADIARVQAEINALDPTGRIRADQPENYIQATAQVRLAEAMVWLTSAVAVIIGVIGMLNTMMMSVFERTREIGILRAMGWRPRRVLGMILGEALILSLGGFVFGTLGGILLTRVLPWLGAVGNLIQGRIFLSVIFEGLALALAAGLIGACYPAFRGARLLPTEALRHE